MFRAEQAWPTNKRSVQQIDLENVVFLGGGSLMYNSIALGEIEIEWMDY